MDPSPPKAPLVRRLHSWLLPIDALASTETHRRRARLTLWMSLLLLGFAVLYAATGLLTRGLMHPGTLIPLVSTVLFALPPVLLKQRRRQTAALVLLVAFAGGVMVSVLARGGLQNDALVWLPPLTLLSALLLGRRWMLVVAAAGAVFILVVAALPSLGVTVAPNPELSPFVRTELLLTLLGIVTLVGFLFERLHDDYSRRLQETLDELRRSEARLHSVLDSTQELIMGLDAEMRVLVVNGAALSAAARLFGRELHVGMRIEEFLPPEVWCDFGPAAKAALDGEVRTLELHVPIHSGGIEIIDATFSPTHSVDGGPRGVTCSGRLISQRHKAEQQLRWLASFPEDDAHPILELDAEGHITYLNPAALEAFADLYEQGPEHPLLLGVADVMGRRDEQAVRNLTRELDIGGKHYEVHLSSRPESGALRVRAYDISHRLRAEEERRQMEERLRQSHKLEAIGQLAAGVAHEINTPMQFIGHNTSFIRGALDEISALLEELDACVHALERGEPAASVATRMRTALKNADMDFLRDELGGSISETQEGVERISRIVRAMKAFSFSGTGERVLLDVRTAIDSTLLVCRGEYKYVADARLELEEGLPQLECFPADFNQTLLNLLVNAAHAVADTPLVKAGGRGNIVVRARVLAGALLEVSVSDDGVGISPEHRARLFEPFFTTKEVGRGTGQGLAFCYSALERHHGTISFESTPGKGTTFITRWPIRQERASREPARLAQ